MSKRKGVQVPRNGFLETISSRFSEKQSCFVLGIGYRGNTHIVYCSDGFCELTGYPRSQVMQRSCSCNFLYGENTDEAKQEDIFQSLLEEKEYHAEIILYKRDGTQFHCLLDIITTLRKQGDLIFLVSLKEVETDYTPKSDQGNNWSHAGKVESPTSNNVEGAPFNRQRRRSRAVLQFHYQDHCDDAMSNLLSDRRVLACQIDYSAKKSKYVIPHYGYFRTVWDWIMLIFSFYILIFVPYYAAIQFQHISEFGFRNSTKDSSHPFSFWCDIGLEFIFIIDVALNFRTTFVNKRGQLESYSKKIASHYLKSTFIWDLLGSIPFDFIRLICIWTAIHPNIPFDMLKTVRLARMYKFYLKIINLSHYRPFVLLYLMIIFALIAHWIACIWFGIGWFEFYTTRTDEADGPGWLFELGESMHTPFFANKTGGPEVVSVYIASLYFTLSSLTSVGFGNVSANTNTEKIFSVVTMLIGAVMHAYIFGNITAVIQRIYATRSELARREGNLKEFLKKNRFKKPLYRKLTGYFQTSWSLNKGVDEEEVTREFPKDLQADIAMHLHSDLLELPIFRNACQGCKRYASLHASRRMVAPEEVLIHVGDPLEHAFLVCSGSLEATKEGVLYAFLGKGDFFGGDVSNDSILISKLQVQALTFCELQCISIHGLKQIAKLYPSQRDIAREIGEDYSCKLWDNLVLNPEELKQQRNWKIQNWNEHYDVNKHNESNSSSSSAELSCAEVTITIEPDSEQEKSNENNWEAGKTLLRRGYFSNKQGRRQTLQVPTFEIPGARSESRSSSSTGRCSTPCLRSNERRNCIKKRVSFDDGRIPDDNVYYGHNETDHVDPISSNGLWATSEVRDESSSGPMLNGPLHRSLSLQSKNLQPSRKYNSTDVSVKKEGLSWRNELSSTLSEKQDKLSFRGRKSSSPGTSGESRRRRRRRKPAHKHERTSTSPSSDEATNRTEHKRERKMSVVEIYRDPVKSLIYQRHSSPDSRSSECDCQVAAMERKLKDLQNLVLTMSRNVDMILDAKHHSNKANEDDIESGYVCRPAETGSIQKICKRDSEPDMSNCVDGHEFDSKSDDLNRYRCSELKSRPRVMNNRTDQMTSGMRNESQRFPALRRPHSAPSFCSTSSSFAIDCGMLKTCNDHTARFNADSDLCNFKSVSNITRYSPEDICDEGTFNQIEPTVFIDNGSTKFPDQGISSVLCFPSDGGAAAHDFESPLLQSSRDRESSNSNLPVISISTCEQYMMRESTKRSSPKRQPSVRESQSYLQIPNKRHLGGGSESGYSTSPSPDISCV